MESSEKYAGPLKRARSSWLEMSGATVMAVQIQGKERSILQTREYQIQITQLSVEIRLLLDGTVDEFHDIEISARTEKGRTNTNCVELGRFLPSAMKG